jgi:hypothetical protein
MIVIVVVMKLKAGIGPFCEIELRTNDLVVRRYRQGRLIGMPGRMLGGMLKGRLL